MPTFGFTHVNGTPVEPLRAFHAVSAAVQLSLNRYAHAAISVTVAMAVFGIRIDPGAVVFELVRKTRDSFEG